jgi:hypothetical protein
MNTKIFNVIYVWASDFRESSGEGRLARLYVQKALRCKYNYVKVISPDFNYIFINKKIYKRTKKKRVNFNSNFYKYFYPLMGCVISWYYFIFKKNFVYLNYLPLWNFLIFVLLAPKTKIGPITGSKILGRDKIRRFIIPFLYKISILIIYIRNSNIFFSTDNLEHYVKKKLPNKKFNFVLKYLKKEKNITHIKTNDVVVYFRKHNNKNNNFFKKITKWMVKEGISITAYGDFLNVKGVKNLGNIKFKKSIEVIKKSKIAINSSENFYTFFMMDCLNNGTYVLCDKKTLPNKVLLNKYIIQSDYEKFIITYKKLLNCLDAKY